MAEPEWITSLDQLYSVLQPVTFCSVGSDGVKRCRTVHPYSELMSVLSPSADDVEIDPSSMPTADPPVPPPDDVNLDTPDRTFRFSSATALVLFNKFYIQYRAMLYNSLITKYLVEGYTGDQASARASADLLSSSVDSLFSFITTYDGSTASYITPSEIDLSYSFHSAKISAFSDYTVGVFPWMSFYDEDVSSTPMAGAFSPFLIDPVIFNSYSQVDPDYVVIGGLGNSCIFLVRLSDFSVLDVKRVPDASHAFCWSIGNKQAVVVGVQAVVKQTSIEVDPERKGFGTRIFVLPFSGGLLGGTATTYILPCASVVGFGIVDGITYIATSFCNGDTQYTNIIDASTRDIIFREELHLSSFLGVPSLNDIRVSPFTWVRFFKHNNYVVAAIAHSHTLCTGITKNVISFCRHDPSISQTVKNAATYYSCRIRSFSLPERYFSVMPLSIQKMDDGKTRVLMTGYTGEDINA